MMPMTRPGTTGNSATFDMTWNKFQNNMAATKGPVLPTHYRSVNVQRSGLRVREKYVLVLICGIFCFLMFGAFFFVPELGSAGYLQAGKQALSKLVYNARKDGAVVPIKPPVNNDLDDVLNGKRPQDYYSSRQVYLC